MSKNTSHEQQYIKMARNTDGYINIIYDKNMKNKMKNSVKLLNTKVKMCFEHSTSSSYGGER